MPRYMVERTFPDGRGLAPDKRGSEAAAAAVIGNNAKGMTHYAWFTEDTILQLHGMGPQGITYVDPSKDPRKQ